MSVPVSQMFTVATYVLGQRLARAEALSARAHARAALPLQPRVRGLRQDPVPRPDPEEAPHAWSSACAAVEECGAPMVTIPGGEPLMHPEIDRLVAGLVARKKYIYLCTNAILLKEKLDLFTPSKYLTFSVHMDGLREDHDEAVCRDGVYDQAVEAIRAAVRPRLPRHDEHARSSTAPSRSGCAQFFDEMMALGVEGMMISPGYSYAKAPDQEHFLRRAKTAQPLHARCCAEPKRDWRFNQSPLFLGSSWASTTSSARRGAIRPTTCSAGSGRAISSRKATRRRSRS